MNGKVLGIPLALIILVIVIVVPLAYLQVLNYQQSQRILQVVNNVDLMIATSKQEEVVPVEPVAVVEPTIEATATPKAKVSKQTFSSTLSTVPENQ